MSFVQPQQPQRRAAVPLAPMLDVLFLLLIFFVTTSTFRAEEQQMAINLPAAEAAEAARPRRTEVVVNIEADGTILIGSQAYEPQALAEMLRRLVADFPDEHLIIRGDRDVRYEHVVRVMDLARSAGIRNIYFATVKRAGEIAP